MRDITGDYRRAYIAEYEALRAVGRDAQADAVAAILRDHYGYEVAGAAESSDPGGDQQPGADPADGDEGASPDDSEQENPLERADETAPEAAVPPKPQRRRKS